MAIMVGIVTIFDMKKNTSEYSRPKKRLVLRLIALGFFVSLALFLQLRSEMYGVIAVTVFYILWCFFDLGDLGRLKSRPDSDKITITEFFNEDSIARYILMLYFMLMILVFELYNGNVEKGHSAPFFPLSFFIFGAFCFWRIYRLEVRTTES